MLSPTILEVGISTQLSLCHRKDDLSVFYKDKQVPVVVDLPRPSKKKTIKSGIKGEFYVILTHGAGGDMNLPQLSDLAAVLSSAGFVVIRFTCKGLNIKHRTNVFGCVADSVCAKYKPKGIIIGGRSMGSRAAAMLGGQTGEDKFCSTETFKKILGVICVSYPLHRPKNFDSELRDSPLISCAKPIVFVSGTSDAMCRKDLLKKTCDKLSIKYSVHWLEGFDHGLQVKSEEKQELFNNAAFFLKDWCCELCAKYTK